MPDLLAHVFLAYALSRALSWHYGWLDGRYVTVAMIGAFVPDLVKVSLVVPEHVVADILGVPFGWGSLATGGGVLVSVLVGVVLLADTERRAGGAILALGAASHLLTDGLLLTPTGRTVQFFWPLSQYTLPSPGLYLSTQPGPTIVTGLAAGVVWLVHRARFRDSPAD